MSRVVLTAYTGTAGWAATEVPTDWIPSQMFNGVGVLTLLVVSWWLLVRGTLHTDSEFQFVLAQMASKDLQLTAKDNTIAEVLDQNRTLIEANQQVVHVLEGFKAAAEAKS